MYDCIRSYHICCQINRPYPTQHHVHMPLCVMWVQVSAQIWQPSREHMTKCILSPGARLCRGDRSFTSKQTHWHLALISREQEAVKLMEEKQKYGSSSRRPWCSKKESRLKKENAKVDEDRTDRQASHKASDPPIPECRFILNAVRTAGPSLKDTHINKG